jgi:hypothetical protein
MRTKLQIKPLTLSELFQKSSNPLILSCNFTILNKDKGLIKLKTPRNSAFYGDYFLKTRESF